jgi:hypothetical protein
MCSFCPPELYWARRATMTRSAGIAMALLRGDAVRAAAGSGGSSFRYRGKTEVRGASVQAPRRERIPPSVAVLGASATCDLRYRCGCRACTCHTGCTVLSSKSPVSCADHWHRECVTCLNGRRMKTATRKCPPASVWGMASWSRRVPGSPRLTRSCRRRRARGRRM